MDGLQGWKTHIVAAVLVLLGIASAMGINIPGVQLGPDWIVVALNGLGLSALRSGINTAATTVANASASTAQQAASTAVTLASVKAKTT